MATRPRACKVIGFGTSDNAWIGPTTNLQMVLPFEDDQFFSNSAVHAEEETYRALLGHLAGFPALWEAYEAGKLGRSEIIAHGTTIDPGFYKRKPWYPCTPSLGCLCSPESWDAQGCLQYSAQAQWIRLLQQALLRPRWLIVAEVADLAAHATPLRGN